jgi:hypothetical protein
VTGPISQQSERAFGETDQMREQQQPMASERGETSLAMASSCLGSFFPTHDRIGFGS